MKTNPQQQQLSLRHNAPGTIYVLHLDPAYKHARHYIGWTQGEVTDRLDAHLQGRGSPLIRAAVAAGIDVQLAATYPRNAEPRTTPQAPAQHPPALHDLPPAAQHTSPLSDRRHGRAHPAQTAGTARPAGGGPPLASVPTTCPDARDATASSHMHRARPQETRGLQALLKAAILLPCRRSRVRVPSSA